MFTQIISNIITNLKEITYWIFDGSKTIRWYIQNFAKINAKRISAFMMASKMLSVIVLLAFLPIDSGKIQKIQPQNLEVKLNTSSPIAVEGKNRQVALATGESQIDMQTKSSVSKVVSSQSVTYSNIERDPSYFRGLYQRAGAAYGVPWQLIEAVHYIEIGCSDSTNESSYAGAQGPMQFMPGTWRTYGVDANGDGVAQATNVDDAVFGAANLLAAGGAAEGNYQSALLNYNHAQWYVDKVMGVAHDAGLQ